MFKVTVRILFFTAKQRKKYIHCSDNKILTANEAKSVTRWIVGCETIENVVSNICSIVCSHLPFILSHIFPLLILPLPWNLKNDNFTLASFERPQVNILDTTDSFVIIKMCRK